jgi:hypothetical protein
MAAIGFGSLRPAPAHANPAKIWVINDNVASAIAASPVSPSSFDTALATSAGRAPYLTQFDAFQSASGGQVAPAAAIPFAGTVFVVVQTDGSGTNVTVNGRGLTCIPACDAVTASTPDATDHILVYLVTGTGSHSAGDAFTVTAIQDAVSLDSRTIAVVGQAHDIALSVTKTAIQAGLVSCSLSDNAGSPQRTGASATYTDISGTPVVGYGTTWVSSSVPNMLMAQYLTPSMVQPDGVTVAAANIACGVSAGSADLQAANYLSGAVIGVAVVTRTQTITVSGTLPRRRQYPTRRAGERPRRSKRR